MRASLDKSLLLTMLSRGGWLYSAERVLAATCSKFMNDPESKEWTLSRYLSRACALAFNWSGNGLDDRPALVESSAVDFTEMGDGSPGPEEQPSSGLLFNTSACGQFLCVARDTLIYIYDFHRGSIAASTIVVCPRRVLSMSMDVSAGRHASAALLEGRMGIVCELRQSSTAGVSGPMQIYAGRNGPGPRTTSSISASMGRTSGATNALDLGHCVSRHIRGSFPTIQARNLEPFNAVSVQSDHQDINLRGTDDHRTYDRNLINPTWNLDLHGPQVRLSAGEDCKRGSCGQSIPVERGTSTYYRHLCSEDDPPRSVSICPQRRCVAFGCSAGIELHWVDAITGQSLSRWFPLTAPSDYLYFLSPRPGLESAQKLRLISSAAHPKDRPAIRRKFFSARPTGGSFWAFGLDSSSRHPGSPGFDHFHAIPLSDGHHVLFIDPSTLRLSLGCDAPLGGPTKLIRKITLIPPEEKMAPRLFRAATDLSHGARVAVVYGDMIMLYSVPSDVLEFSRDEQTGGK